MPLTILVLRRLSVMPDKAFVLLSSLLACEVCVGGPAYVVYAAPASVLEVVHEAVGVNPTAFERVCVHYKTPT